MSASSVHRLLLSMTLGFGLTGCSLFDGLNDQFADDGSVLSVFATHHASPYNGVFPPRDGPPRFVTDMGWDVVLADAYITTTGATLFSCATEKRRSLEMYWGALPEDLRDLDLVTTPIGGVGLDSGDWCGINVQYGPFMPGEDGDYEMGNPDAIGTTMYIQGLASKDGMDVPFEVIVDEPVAVIVSMTDIDGGRPLKVTDTKDIAITISKSYDRLFDGIDFANYTDEELRDIALASLSEYTRVSLGNAAKP